MYRWRFIATQFWGSDRQEIDSVSLVPAQEVSGNGRWLGSPKHLDRPGEDRAVCRAGVSVVLSLFQAFYGLPSGFVFPADDNSRPQSGEFPDKSL